MSGQSQLTRKGNETQLTCEALGVARREFMHCQGYIGEGLLDVGAMTVGDPAAIIEDHTDTICAHFEIRSAVAEYKTSVSPRWLHQPSTVYCIVSSSKRPRLVVKDRMSITSTLTLRYVPVRMVRVGHHT